MCYWRMKLTLEQRSLDFVLFQTPGSGGAFLVTMCFISKYNITKINIKVFLTSEQHPLGPLLFQVQSSGGAALLPCVTFAHVTNGHHAA